MAEHRATKSGLAAEAHSKIPFAYIHHPHPCPSSSCLVSEQTGCVVRSSSVFVEHLALSYRISENTHHWRDNAAWGGRCQAWVARGGGQMQPPQCAGVDQSPSL
ncbi:hypothetical protein HPB50_024098 [Hyalomma asiaticum]|uniref:Uncharacterized protein n=1 Tax=Hyalomma asiaticum TaxID=266040 RepID=A0ACB7S2R2_HYAAI|nr:hypothetical protein HPB50_024098 [Hyalomma asiaticum]